MQDIVKWIAAACGGAVAFLFGKPFETAFLVLVALMCIDFITGLAHAAVERELDSKACARGIMKKVFILALIAVAHMVDSVMGTAVVMTAAEFFYIANEAMSIIENAGRAGLPVPEALKNVLKQLNEKGGGANDVG